MSVHKKAAAVAAQRAIIASQSSQASSDVKIADADQSMRDSGVEEDPTKKNSSTGDVTKPSQTSLAATQPNADTQTASTTGQPSMVPTSAPTSNDATPPQPRQPWDYVDEILNLMKTGHPLLVLTIETMVYQILLKFKASAEEEIYRLVCMLLVDAVQVILCSSIYIIQLLTGVLVY
jgi:transformation/transcription domain-associated protein